MQIKLSKQAEKYIERLDKPTKVRIRNGILGLTETPPKGDTRLLQGHTDEYRLRIGNYRIIYKYTSTHEVKILIVNKIDTRGDVYK